MMQRRRKQWAKISDSVNIAGLMFVPMKMLNFQLIILKLYVPFSVSLICIDTRDLTELHIVSRKFERLLVDIQQIGFVSWLYCVSVKAIGSQWQNKIVNLQ